MSNKEINMFRVIDLFCGAGGLTNGFFQTEKFKIVGAVDNDIHAVNTYRINHDNVPVYCKDISEFTTNQLDFDISDIDLIIGGPPCQAYSTVGKRLLDDPRGKLFHEYYRIIKEICPKAFVFENVKGILSIQNGKLLENIVTLFEEVGYNTQFQTLNAVDYGVPQMRERVIIVGTLSTKPYSFPIPSHKNNPLTLKDALSDLPLVPDSAQDYVTPPQNSFQEQMRKNSPEKIIDHHTTRHNKKLQELMDRLEEGGSPKDLPVHLRPSSGFGNSYSRLWWNRPCTTITRNFGTPSSSRCIHPKQPRSLTIREAARIQGFPDHYQFCGTQTNKKIQIGNAVPPILARHLAESFFKYFNESR